MAPRKKRPDVQQQYLAGESLRQGASRKLAAAPRATPLSVDPSSVQVQNRGTPQQAMTQRAPGGGMGATAVPAVSVSGGPSGASVPSSLTAPRAGTTIAAPEGLIGRAMGGTVNTTTRTPMYSPFTGNVLSMQESTDVENPLTTQDLAATAMGDVEAYRQVKEQSRGIAEQALSGVQQSYGTALDEMTGQFGEAEGRMRAEQPTFGDVEGQFDRAWGMAEAAAGQATSYASAQTARAEAWREEALDNYTDTFALRHDQLRKGMESEYNRRMDSLDDAVAQGRVVGSGGLAAGQVAAAAKAQLKSEYQGQLRGLSGQLAAEESRISSSLRATIDQYSLASIGQAQGMAAGTAIGAANIGAQLAAAEANARSIFGSLAQQNELGLLQADLAIQKMRVEEPQLAAEIMMSRAYMPDAIALYPLMKELSDLYDGDVSGTTVPGGGMMASYGGNPMVNWGPGTDAGGKPPGTAPARPKAPAKPKAPANPAAPKAPTPPKLGPGDDVTKSPVNQYERGYHRSY